LASCIVTWTSYYYFLSLCFLHNRLSAVFFDENTIFLIVYSNFCLLGKKINAALQSLYEKILLVAFHEKNVQKVSFVWGIAEMKTVLQSEKSQMY